ncbi:MAG: trypsin-like peptidase domain-containing protein [Oscillospiraceae bacterium]|nr:trypsin-like peptidase domain-containing protein [Oscillospiraceae bacterium]
MMDENKKELGTGESILPEETPENVREPDVPAPAEEREGASVPAEPLGRIEYWFEPPENDDEPEDEPVGSKFDELYVTVPRQTADTWKKAATREKKRRRLTRWIIVICLLAVLGAVTAALWPTLFPREKNDGQQKPEEGDSASSIVDIIGSQKTEIPLIKGDPNVRLNVQTQRGDVLAPVDIYAKVNPSVVMVVAENGAKSSVGTGIIMTSDGYIITNAHVISGGKACWVALDTGVTYDVKLVGFDKDEDLAVLKAENAKNLPAAEFGDSESLQVGEPAYAIGNPLGVELRGTMTDGIISAVNRQIEVEGGSMTMIQTTAALNNGNSGGPLINSSGQIVGINTIKMSGGGWSGEATVEGLGFALPISSVYYVVNDIIAYGAFRGVPTFGITVITNRSSSGTQVEVHSVDKDFGAAEAGVQPGDIIVAADGRPITQTADLLTVRRSHVVGDTVTLTILRNGRTMDVDVVLYSNKGK